MRATTGGSSPARTKKQRDAIAQLRAAAHAPEIEHLVKHYADSPRRNARRLRDLGLTAEQVRYVHRSATGTSSQARSKQQQKTAGFRAPRDFFSRLGEDLFDIGLYTVPGAISTANEVRKDVQDVAHGHPGFKRTRHIAAETVKGFAHDLTHPGEHPGFFAADVSALFGGVGGALTRGAATRGALREGATLAHALTRKGHEGGSLLHRPEPGSHTLRVGDSHVTRPLYRNPLARAIQRPILEARQHALDRGAPEEMASNVRGVVERHAAAEASYGRGLDRKRRLNANQMHGPLLEHERSTHRLSRAEHAALRVVAIEGDRALTHPAEVLGRHIRTHELLANGESRAAHLAQVDYLKSAAKVLANPSPKFLTAVEATRSLSQAGERLAADRGHLDPTVAESRRARIAAHYQGGDLVDGPDGFVGVREPGARSGYAVERERRNAETILNAERRKLSTVERRIAKLGPARRRRRETVDRPRTKAEAQARLAELDKTYEQLVQKFIPETSPFLDRKGETLRRNSQAAKHGGRYAKPTVKAEERKFAEAKIHDLIERHPHKPQIRRLAALVAERTKLQETLNEAALPELGGAGRVAPFGTVPETRLGARRRKIDDRLQALRASVAEWEQEHARLEGEGPTVREVKAPEGSFYFPAGEQLGVRRKGGRIANPRPSATGVAPTQAGRYDPGLTARFTGRALRRGHLPLNVSKAIAETYARRIHLASAHDLYQELRDASHETRQSRYDIPVRLNPKISDELRRAISEISDNLDASPDELAALVKQGLGNLAHQLEAREHAGRELGAKIEGVRWVDRRFLRDLGENSPRGAFAKIADAINNPLRVATLYFRPAYALNKLGNYGMLAASDVGTLKHAKRARQLRSRFGEQGAAMVDALMSSGKARGQSVDTGLGRKVSQGMADWWGKVTDLDERRMAFLREAEKAGHASDDAVLHLMREPEFQDRLGEVVERGKRIIGDYEHMTPTERQSVRRAIYFYPWLKVAMRWTGNFAVEHPVKTAVGAQQARVEQDEIKRLFGKIPDWFHFAGYTPAGDEHNGLVPTVNLTSINTPASAAQTLGAIPNTARAIVGLKQKGAGGLLDLLTPAGEIAAGVTGAETHGQPGGLIGALESLPETAALRRLGLPLGHKSKTFPETGVPEAVGPLLIGGLYPRGADKAVLNKQGEKDDLAQLSPPERVDYHHQAFARELRHAVEATGSQMTPVLRARVQLRYERTHERARVGYDTPQKRLRADLNVIVRHGWMSEEKARKVIRAAAINNDYDDLSTYFSRHFFDRDGELSSALSWLRKNGHPDLRLPPLPSVHRSDP